MTVAATPTSSISHREARAESGAERRGRNSRMDRFMRGVHASEELVLSGVKAKSEKQVEEPA
jgi:hypothetical protein